jgi:hypothetical protein
MKQVLTKLSVSALLLLCVTATVYAEKMAGDAREMHNIVSVNGSDQSAMYTDQDNDKKEEPVTPSEEDKDKKDDPTVVTPEKDDTKQEIVCPSIETVRTTSITEINCDDPTKFCQSKGFFTNKDSIWYTNILFGKGVFEMVPDFHVVKTNLQKLSIHIDQAPMVSNEVIFVCHYAGDGLIVVVSNNEQILQGK